MFHLIGFLVSILALIKLIFYLISRWNRRQFEWARGEHLWAVVTGATDGIGFELARQLALKGYNLMLLSRNEEKLKHTVQLITESVAAETRGECSVQFRTLPVDFSHRDIYHKIELFLQADQHDIYILVNNVGCAPGETGYFHREDRDMHERLINVNLLSTVKLTEMILPSMVQKGRGLVVNLSSASGFFPIATLATYGSSKAFITHFSRSLAEECRRHNVLIHNLSPNFVSTKMTYYTAKNMIIPSARKYVSTFLSSIRYMDDTESDGYVSHTIIRYLIQTVIVLTSNYFVRRFVHHFFGNVNQIYREHKEVKRTRERKSFKIPPSIVFNAVWKAMIQE